MIEKVSKRDGSVVPFDESRIYSAISSAYAEVYGELTEEKEDEISQITDNVIESISSVNETVDVETIQNIVEQEISAVDFCVAKAYITYRYKREMARNDYNALMDIVSEKLKAENVENQNANVDEKSFGGRIGSMSGAVAKHYALNYCMSKKAKENHLNNTLYTHDLDSYTVGMHNCLTSPIDKLLAKGFNTRQCDVRPANSISTAFQLVAVIFQIQSLQQFGGVSAGHIDWSMIPYVRKSFTKHLGDGLRYVEKISEYKTKRFHKWIANDKENHPDGTIHFDDKEFQSQHPEAWEYAMDMTIKETYQAVEGMYHNLNTLQSRSGNQLPFSSINYGTCTLPEGRLIIKALLDTSIKGVGKLHKTSIFPCGIFQMMKGVNRKSNDPNYDLYRLALKSTAKRLYPNYANVDWSGNTGYDPNDPKTYFSTMGALAGHEHLYVKKGNGSPIDITIKDLFDMIKAKEDISGRAMQLYYNKLPLDIPTDVNWRHNQIRSMSDIKAQSGVYKITYLPQDVSYIGSSKNIQQRIRDHKKEIRHTGGLDSGLFFGDANIDNYSFEVIEYTSEYKEAEKKYIQVIPNANYKGVSTKFYKNVGITKGRGSNVRPDIAMNPDIPQDYISLEDFDYKVLDRNNTWVKIKHIFKNDKMNTPLMMHITYRENNKVYTLCCTEDHPLWNGERFIRADKLNIGDHLYRADNVPLEIVEIKYHTNRVDSYDIGTETGSFIGSDIIMHNCRTANGWDINGFGQLKDGRGNICPVTIILPTLAMMANGEIGNKDIESFMNILVQKIGEAREQLIERFEWICSQSPDSARFMYENGTMAGYVPEEGIRSALKHGTLAIGQLGLAETLQILIGKDHTTDEGMALAKRIEGIFKELCAKYKEQDKLNFGVYYTPAENLCYTAMSKFKKEYGEIPNISDREYFTNSIHVPVWHELTPFEKIDIEAQLTGYSSAGCITYVELPESAQNNIDALETIINYAMDKDIPYFAINVPNDICDDCGFTGEMNDVCPKCGSSNIKRLRRVTGYLTGDYKTAFNIGKQREAEQRVKHIQ